MSLHRSEQTAEAGQIPIVDLTGLAERLDREAAALRFAADRVQAHTFPLRGAPLQLVREADRAAALLDDVRRLLDGRL